MTEIMEEGTKKEVVVTQSRWRSPVLWAAITAQVFVLLELTGLAKAMGLDLGLAGKVTAAIFGLLVILGVLNNPSAADVY